MIDNKYNLIKLTASYTNHFKWNLNGKKRIENWHTIFNNDKYNGWKDSSKYQKMIDAFNSNLKTYGN